MSKNCSPCEQQATGRENRQPKLSSFLMQILYTLQQMQSESKYTSGATIKQITRYMKGAFKLCGDAYSQVETGVLQGTKYGFIVESNSKFLAIGAIARIQLCKNLCAREQLAEDIREIFLQKSNSKSKRSSCSSDSDEDNRKAKIQTTDITEALTKIVKYIQQTQNRSNSPKCKKRKRKKKSCSDASSDDSNVCNSPSPAYPLLAYTNNQSSFKGPSNTHISTSSSSSSSCESLCNKSPVEKSPHPPAPCAKRKVKDSALKADGKVVSCEKNVSFRRSSRGRSKSASSSKSCKTRERRIQPPRKKKK